MVKDDKINGGKCRAGADSDPDKILMPSANKDTHNYGSDPKAAATTNNQGGGAAVPVLVTLIVLVLLAGGFYVYRVKKNAQTNDYTMGM